MFAIIRTGGKQYKVQAGDLIRVEKLENALGSEFEVVDVLMIGGDASTVIGQPTVKNAKVGVVVTQQSRERKVLVFKKKRRQGYRKFATSRKQFTELFVKSITSPDGKTVKADVEAPVIDAVAKRDEKLQSKVDARLAAKGKSEKTTKKETKTAAAPKKKAATKKVATKKAPAKKAATKKVATKKAPAKKTTAKAK